MAIAVSALKEQIEKAKENLKNVDENIKKITGRDPNEPRPNIEGRRTSTGGAVGREQRTVLGRRERLPQVRIRGEEPPPKKSAPSQVFSRLGPAGGGRRVVIASTRRGSTTQRNQRSRQEDDEEEEDDDEEDDTAVKPTVQSSVVSTAKKITRDELINAQNVGEKGKARNRRMFGVLLGTLTRFQTDSGGPGPQTKQARRQREIEVRLEEQTAAERKQVASQRRTLYNERRAQQRRIQLLEQKVALADECVEWEKEWAAKSKFIMTKSTPAIFFLPKDYTPRTQRALKDSQERIQNIIEKHKKSVEETMSAFDEEIRNLENKPEEDGKGENNTNMGGKGLIGSKFGKKSNGVDDPEEEMDLDSMGPQLDIKVEMDENEGDQGEDLAKGEDVTMPNLGDAAEENPDTDVVRGADDQNQTQQDDKEVDVSMSESQSLTEADHLEEVLVKPESEEMDTDQIAQPATAEANDADITAESTEDQTTAESADQSDASAKQEAMIGVSPQHETTESEVIPGNDNKNMGSDNVIAEKKRSDSSSSSSESESESKTEVDAKGSEQKSETDEEERSPLKPVELNTERIVVAKMQDEKNEIPQKDDEDEEKKPLIPAPETLVEAGGDERSGSVQEEKAKTPTKTQKADVRKVDKHDSGQGEKKEAARSTRRRDSSRSDKRSPEKRKDDERKVVSAKKKRKESSDRRSSEDEPAKEPQKKDVAKRQTSLSGRKFRQRKKSESSSSESESSDDSSSSEEERKRVVRKRSRHSPADRRSSRGSGRRDSRQHSSSYKRRSRSNSRSRRSRSRSRSRGQRERRDRRRR